MAYVYFTARKKLSRHARSDAVIRAFQSYRICYRDSLSTFIAEYARLWTNAHQYGTTAYDGMVRLIYLLPEEWRAWTIMTGRRFITRDHPTYDLTYDAIGFFGAMFADSLRYERVPPPVSEMPPESDPEDLTPWTLTSDHGRPMYEGESSRPLRGKRQRTEDDGSSRAQPAPISEQQTRESAEIARKGKSQVEDESETEYDDISDEDDFEDEDSEECDRERMEPAETDFIPPLPTESPPETPPLPTEPPHYQECTAELARKFQEEPGRSVRASEPVIPDESYFSILAVEPGEAQNPIVIDSDSESDDELPEIVILDD